MVARAKLVPDDWLDLSQLVPFSPGRDYELKTGRLVQAHLVDQMGKLPPATRKSLRRVPTLDGCSGDDLVAVIQLASCNPVVKSPRDPVEVEVVLQLDVFFPKGGVSLTRRYEGRASRWPTFGVSTVGTVLRVATLTGSVVPEMAVLARRAHDEAVRRAVMEVLKDLRDPGFVLQALTTDGPTIARAAAERGLELFQRGHWRQAYWHLHRALALDPASQDAAVFAGAALARLGETGAARQTLQLAIELDEVSEQAKQARLWLEWLESRAAAKQPSRVAASRRASASPAVATRGSSREKDAGK